jgi:putative nucleotidyltransferase with HDIG domain
MEVETVVSSVAMFQEESVFPLPEVAWRVLEMTTELHHSTQELADIVSRDQALTAKTLQMANSALFGVGGTVSTIRRAVTVLGNRKLRAVAVAASLEGVLNGTASGKSIWEHSLAVALTARVLAQECGYKDPEEAFVGGLLHDVGKSLLDQNFPQRYREVIEEANAIQVPLMEVELWAFGMDHCQVGGALVDSWDLPDHLKEAIRLHHCLSQAKEEPVLCATVGLADSICSNLRLGISLRAEIDLQSSEAASVLGLRGKRLESILDSITNLIKEQTNTSGSRWLPVTRSETGPVRL